MARVCISVGEHVGVARRAFALFASAIMLLVIFQVVVGEACAALSSSDLELIDSTETASQEDVVLPAEEIAEGATSLEETPPEYGPVPSGTVESYGVTPDMPVSTLSNSPCSSELLVVDGLYSFRTSYGTYSVDSEDPWSISLRDNGGIIHVTSSYFTLKCSDVILAPSAGQVLQADDNLITCRYTVADTNPLSDVQGLMEVSLEFPDSTSPKITALVVNLTGNVRDWSVVWIVDVPESYCLLSSDGREVPLSNYYWCTPPARERRIQCASPGAYEDGRSATFVIDWSDAMSGIPRIAPGDSVVPRESRFTVEFDEGVAEIDPTLISTSNYASATGLSCQRKTFWYDGYYWAFYNNAGYIRYSCSRDGNSWAATSILDTSAGNSVLVSYGFDVYQRAGKVIVGWTAMPSGYAYYAKMGTITDGTVKWSDLYTIYSGAQYPDPVSVTITKDGTYWFLAQATSGNIDLWYYSEALDSFINAFGVPTASNNNWYSLLPTSDSGLALVYASDGSTSVIVHYFLAGRAYGPYGGVPDTIGGITSGSKANAFSATIGPDSRIHIAYVHAVDNYLAYSYFDDSWNGEIVTSGAQTSPSIALDGNGVVHIFYGAGSTAYSVRHKEGHMDNDLTDLVWSSERTLYSTSNVLGSISCWCTPAGSNAFVFTEYPYTYSVRFMTCPIPYGSSGVAVNPWDREGISPYGIYFSSIGDLISPGSGLLNFMQTDLSVPGRGGVDLEVTRLYSEPRYFWKSSGSPYTTYSFPNCPMGLGWGLDLPWLSDMYVTISGGQRFLIQWGNNGNYDEFENHEGTHFILRYFNVWNGRDYVEFYELRMSSGVYYQFDAAGRLTYMSSGFGVDPDLIGDFGDNYLYFSYDASNRVYTIEDDMGRALTFAYDATSGKLQSITRPDGRSVSYGYTYIASQYLLTSVTDPMNRVTSYTYYSGSSYSNCVLLATVTFPSDGKFVYSYAVDDTAGTDVRSWIVTSRETRDASSGALIRQTVFDPKIVGGRIQFTKVTEKDEAAATQGWREYILNSRLMYTSEVAKSSSGTQMYKKITWYDSLGQPVKVDTYEGTSTTMSYTEYMSYDDWGNVIFTKNAMGYESYASYINTGTQNSFQGGMVLKRTSSGCVLYDGFDDWDASDWSQASSGGSISIDGAVNSIGAPALKLVSSTSEVYAYSTIASQTGDLVLQINMMAADTATSSYVELLYGSTTRIRIAISGGAFQYWPGGVQQPVPNCDPCLDNTWYDVSVYVTDFATNAYSIYIDGEWKVDATMMGTTGTGLNTLKVRSLLGTTLWVDHIRLYKGLTIPLDVYLSSGYVAELRDADGTPVDRDDTTLVIPSPATVCAPGTMRIFKVGDKSFETAVMDIWGGDTYSLSLGYSKSYLSKTTNGFGKYTSHVPDDSDVGTWFEYPSSLEGAWVSDHDYSVEGNCYHLSPFTNDFHYHGFSGYSALTVSPTSLLIQYIWLTSGEEPQEIALQYYVGGVWKRAYWGGYMGTDDDMMYVDPSLSPSTVFRVGDIPAQRDSWVQLTVRASDLGITASSTVSGVVYALSGGSARWDVTSYYSSGIQISLPGASYTVDLVLDDGSTISGTSTSTTLTMDLYAGGEKTFPISGHFDISYGGSLLYSGPRVAEIFNGDVYTYSTPEFYANEVCRDLHSAPTAAFNYQKADSTVPQKSYCKLDFDGNVIETKTYTGTSWAYTYAGYDESGNLIWQKDPTGRASFVEYSAADEYTYPVATRQLCYPDYFESGLWTAQESGSASFLAGNYVGYTSFERYYSGHHSTRLSFSGIDDGAVVDSGSLYWDDIVNGHTTDRISSVSVRMYTSAYSHDLDAGEYMDAGIRIRLYDSGGANLATYTYWLACWSSAGDTRSTTDPNIKIVEDRPTLSTWYTYTLYPDIDWNIDWSSCAKVRFELYMTAYIIGGDSFMCYFDDFMTDSDTEYAYEFTTGNLLSETDPHGYQTSYNYDYIGRMTKITYDDGSTKDFIYTDASNYVTSYDETDLKTVTKYDRIGRVSQVDRYGWSTSIQSSIYYTYTWNDQIKTYKDERSHTTSYTYDFLGRPLRTTHPDNTYNEYSYDDANNKITYKDELLHTVWEKTTDDLGRLISVKEYASSTVSYTTTMTYDATGNLLTVVDAKTIARATTAMTYDTLGRQTAITYLLGTTVVASESATYDLAGRPLTRVDKSGTVTTTEYDAAGRVWAVKNPSETVYYFRDAMGRTQMLDGAYDVTYTYNFRGWNTGMQREMKTVTIGYNAAGVMSSITYPNTAQVTYAFDTCGRPNNVKLNGTTVWSGTYYQDDRLNTETLADSTVVTYNYDTRDRLDTATSTRLSLDYHYDAVGNVDGLVSSSGGTESYAYDYLGRMTSATGAWGTISYTYDEVGNRKTKVEGGVTTTYSYDSNGMNRVISDTTPWTYSYDSNGQMTWRTGSSVKYNYIWNNLGQLVQVDKSTLKAGKWTTATVASYTYNADGARLDAFDGPGFTTGVTYRTYFYAGQELWVERSGVSGDLSASSYKYYIYVGGDLKAVWAANEGKVYCYYNDALGSTWQVWTAGAKKATFSVVSYKPFGIPYTPTGTETVKFAGEMLDTATAPSGLYYLRARYMDPELGRFISMDPRLGSLSIPQTHNRYVYCVNNPLAYVDPSGLKTFVPRHQESDMTFDEMMYYIGFVPVIGDVTDIYFLIKYAYEGDWENFVITAVGAAIPFVGGSYLRAGREGGEALYDFLRRADDVPTSSPVRNVGSPPSTPTRGKYIVIGEKQSRVVEFARRYGYETMPELPAGSDFMAANRAWINARMDEGYHIVDIGPFRGKPHYPQISSPFYHMELVEIMERGYWDRYLPVWEVFS